MDKKKYNKPSFKVVDVEMNDLCVGSGPDSGGTGGLGNIVHEECYPITLGFGKKGEKRGQGGITLPQGQTGGHWTTNF